ncbi:MAG: T9SS type A sorting domain-containing protein [Bacteroidales bacterium]|nr:T9SS type A sorting domain-containing protein [Bacteroidales bacterium]
MKNSISNTSSALGIQNTASGEASFASGKLNISLGNFATSLGYSNTAQGMYSLAGGEGSIATGKRSLAWGRYASAESSISLALGSFLRAYGTNAIAMGCFVETTNENAVVIGRGLANDERIINNISGSLMVGFNSNRHTFFVSQAYGLNSTGEIGIGNVTDPSAKLHIVGDSDYLRPNDASLYIESAGNYYSTIYLGDKNHFIKTKPGQDLEFNAAGKDFFFNNGRVGIGTFSPDEKLEVAGNILQPSGWFHATPQIKATDLNGLRLTDKNNIGIFIEDGGNVGIGTNTPDAKLHLYGYPNNSRLRLELNNLEGSYKSWDFNNDNGTLKFQYGSSTTGKPTMEDKMVITGIGNVGIGTDTPSEKLQIADGDIFIQDIDHGIIMRSPDGNCWRGTVNNNGMLEFEQIDCETLETGINNPEPSNSAQIKIYPNPAGNQVFITCEESITGLQLEINDINGQLISSQKLNNSENIINLNSFQPGTYLFRLTDKNGEQIAVEKVIKE